MDVSIINNTKDMVDTISFAAGVCYGKRDYNVDRLRNCYKAGHTGVLEHATVTFLVDGISRACSHQLVRHRLASYCQESQRYLKYSLDSNEWFVTPSSVRDNVFAMASFVSGVREAARTYCDMLTYGVKAEDARYALPNAMKTVIVVTMNIRTLFHFFDLRLGPRAQWEVRELAEKMHDELAKVEPDIISLYDEFRDETRID